MYRSLFISSGFHVGIIILSILAFPFIAKKPIDVLPIISVELIEIGKLTNIPFAPKAKKIIEKAKKKNEKLASEQAPPKKIKKEKNKKKVNLDKNNEIFLNFLLFYLLIGLRILKYFLFLCLFCCCY